MSLAGRQSIIRNHAFNMIEQHGVLAVLSVMDPNGVTKNLVHHEQAVTGKRVRVVQSDSVAGSDVLGGVAGYLEHCGLLLMSGPVGSRVIRFNVVGAAMARGQAFDPRFVPAWLYDLGRNGTPELACVIVR